jgi:hypothetical protein
MTDTTHNIDTWKTILGELASPEGQHMEDIMANRIIGDLIGYRHNSSFRKHDVRQLANALQAYARLLHEHGVTP